VQFILIALGGALGSICRYWLSTAVQRFASPFFPYGTFAVNVLGCLIFGIIVGAARQRFVLGPSERAFLLIGILGGFTTFSSYGLDTYTLFRGGHAGLGLLNAVGQMVIGLSAVWLGFAIGDWRP